MQELILDWFEDFQFAMSYLLCIELRKSPVYIELRHLLRIKKISTFTYSELPIVFG